MERLKAAMEELDEAISMLEDKVGIDNSDRAQFQKKMNDLVKSSRAREASVLAVTQKVAARLDHAIEHVENILRH